MNHCAMRLSECQQLENDVKNFQWIVWYITDSYIKIQILQTSIFDCMYDKERKENERSKLMQLRLLSK